MKFHMFDGKSIIITNLKLPAAGDVYYKRVHKNNNNNIYYLGMYNII